MEETPQPAHERGILNFDEGLSSFLLSVGYVYPQGKLLYCHAPPGMDPQRFNGFPQAFGGGDMPEGAEPGVQAEGVEAGVREVRESVTPGKVGHSS